MNKYDDVQLDVAQLLQEQEREVSSYDPLAKSGDDLGLLGPLKSRLGLYLTGLLYRTGVYQKLIYSNMKLDWFY